ncbi:hypothetical protein [Pedobacter miscanthi]|uniref:hypothetical protein n=1 Tax=Pedobacter miscanthi TaxID=2259170 RepID=UPI00292D413B|nr:hypothetical protein [Pedobacter miscanthi]
MNIKAAAFQKQIKIGADLVVIDRVKGDDLLYRIMINQNFKGYIQKRDGLFHRIDGSDIHTLLFARICQVLEN